MKRTSLERRTRLRAKRKRGPRATTDRAAKAKARRRARREREWARAYHSEERVQAVKRMPCAVPGCHELSENAHTENGGTGRRADACTIANLCSGHHRTRTDSLHNLGSVEAFQRVHGIDLRRIAAAVERRFPTTNSPKTEKTP